MHTSSAGNSGVRLAIASQTTTRRHFRRQMFVAGAGLLLLLCGACSRNRDEFESEPIPPTILRVQNQAFLDMRIYAYRSSQRVRLGEVTGNSTAKLTIPNSLVAGVGSLRFQADPIGGNRQSITQEVSVTPGDEVVMIIPP